MWTENNQRISLFNKQTLIFQTCTVFHSYLRDYILNILCSHCWNIFEEYFLDEEIISRDSLSYNTSHCFIILRSRYDQSSHSFIKFKAKKIAISKDYFYTQNIKI